MPLVLMHRMTVYALAKTGEYLSDITQVIFPNFKPYFQL